MNIKNGQEAVANWMRRYGQETPDKSTVPDKKTCGLRSKLSLEETVETILKGFGIRFLLCPSLGLQIDFQMILEALKKPDAEFVQMAEPNLEQIADGGADKLVVTLGDFAACGIKAQECFDEVMRSNDSKMWTFSEVFGAAENSQIVTIETAAVGDEVQLKNGFTAKLVSNHGRCWLIKDASGKVIKSESYTPADFTRIL